MCGAKHHMRANAGASLVENGCGLDRTTPIGQGFHSAAEYAKYVGDAARAESNTGRVLQAFSSRQRVAHVDERAFELTERAQGASQAYLDVNELLECFSPFRLMREASSARSKWVIA